MPSIEPLQTTPSPYPIHPKHHSIDCVCPILQNLRKYELMICICLLRFDLEDCCYILHRIPNGINMAMLNRRLTKIVDNTSMSVSFFLLR